MVPGKQEEVLLAIEQALEKLRDSRPEERNEYARCIAVTITELEKVFAYYKTYVYDRWGA